MFAVYASDGDNTKVAEFTLTSTEGTKIYLDGQRIRGWLMVGDAKQKFLYSESKDGAYVPIYGGEFTGTFKNGYQDTIGWVKSFTGTFTLYVLFIY